MMLSYSAKAEYPVTAAFAINRNDSDYWIIRFRG
jgi:hypothetical protein